MGKAILIVDMPKSCAGCSLCYDNYGCSYHCSAADKDIEESLMNQGIQDWCPLTVMHEHEHGHWFLLDECANAGVYCSVCHKKVYKEHYANVRPKSKFCPHCGAIMDGEFVRL